MPASLPPRHSRIRQSRRNRPEKSPRHLPSWLRSTPTRVVAVLTVLAVGLGVSFATTREDSSAAMQPAKRWFTAPIDAYPHWESEKGCNPGVKPGVISLIDDVLKPTYGGDSWRFGKGRACIPQSETGHDNGTALDWMMNSKNWEEKQKAEGFLSWLLGKDAQGNPQGNARRLGVMYVIWNDRMFRLYRANEGWLPYSTYVNGWRQSCPDNLQDSSYDTICHRDHVHISLTWQGAWKKTSFWGNSPAPFAPYQPEEKTSAALMAKPTTSWKNLETPKSLTLRGITSKPNQTVQLYMKVDGRPGATYKPYLTSVTSDWRGRWAKRYLVGLDHWVYAKNVDDKRVSEVKLLVTTAK